MTSRITGAHHLAQVHGFPRVMGVLTHLDGFKEQAHLKKTKKSLKVLLVRGPRHHMCSKKSTVGHALDIKR